MDCSLEWIDELASGLKRTEARHILRLAQTVGSAFGGDWSKAQQQLISDIESK